MPPIERTLWVHPAVFQRARGLSDPDKAELTELLLRLSRSPRDRGLGVRPMIQGPPETYTAPFDKALLFYQVLADHPVLHLLQIVDLPA